MKLNILHICDDLSRGGKGNLLYNIFLNKNVCCYNHYFLNIGGGNLLEDFKNINDGKFFYSFRNKGIDLKVVKYIKKIIADNNIEIVHCHDLNSAVNAFPFIYSKKIKKIFSIHGYIYTEILLKTAFFYSIMVCTKVISVSNTALIETRKKYLFLRRMKSAIVYNGVQLTRNKINTQNIKTELSIPKNGILLTMVGSFSEARDQMTVCKAMEVLIKKYDNLYLCFVGGNAGQESFEKCQDYCRYNGLSDKVLFVGERNDIKEILENTDVFIYSSLRDTFSISLVEAMFTGLPIICSNLPVFKEIEDNKNYFEYFSVGNYIQLSIIILKVLNNKNKHYELSQKAKTFATDKYSIISHIKSLEGLYKISFNN